jgi:hypothetical protein
MPSFWQDPFSREPSPYAHVSGGHAQDDIAALVDFLTRQQEPLVTTSREPSPHR